MICENCGTNNAGGTKFCKICGQPLPKDIHSYGDSFTSNASDEKMRRSDNGYSDNLQNAYRREEINQYSMNAARPQYNFQQPDYQRYDPNYYGGSYQGSHNNNSYSRVSPPRGKRSVGAIVIFMINGALALLSLLMSVLPSIDLQFGSDRYHNAFGYAAKILENTGSYGYLDNKSDIQLHAVLVIVMFAVPMLFQLLWAIFSFTRVRAAGVMGLIGSIIYTTVSFYWALFLLDTVKIGNFFYYSGTSKSSYSLDSFEYLSKMMTSVPYLMVSIGIVGIVLSSIEIAKRNRVR